MQFFIALSECSKKKKITDLICVEENCVQYLSSLLVQVHTVLSFTPCEQNYRETLEWKKCLSRVSKIFCYLCTHGDSVFLCK